MKKPTSKIAVNVVGYFKKMGHLATTLIFKYIKFNFIKAIKNKMFGFFLCLIGRNWWACEKYLVLCSESRI